MLPRKISTFVIYDMTSRAWFACFEAAQAPLGHARLWYLLTSLPHGVCLQWMNKVAKVHHLESEHRNVGIESKHLESHEALIWAVALSSFCVRRAPSFFPWLLLLKGSPGLELRAKRQAVQLRKRAAACRRRNHISQRLLSKQTIN